MNQATPGKYAERIERGAALLDEKAPGWRQRINLDTLNLRLGDDCILGQLGEDGDWPDIEDVSCREHGFILGVLEGDFTWADGDTESSYLSEYATLTAGWKQYIEATR